MLFLFYTHCTKSDQYQTKLKKRSLSFSAAVYQLNVSVYSAELSPFSCVNRAYRGHYSGKTGVGCL